MARGTVIKRGDTYSVVLDLGEQPARRCAAGCTHVVVWESDRGNPTRCPKCDAKLTEPKLERRRQWHRTEATSHKAAEQERTRLLREMDTGLLIEPSKMTVQQYLLEKWLPERRPRSDDRDQDDDEEPARRRRRRSKSGRGHRGKLGSETWEKYRQAIQRYAVPRLGHVRLQQLRPEHLEELYDYLEDEGGRAGQGLAPKTVANLHGILHKALSDAVDHDLMARNPADAVAAPTSERVPTDVWGIEQLRRFLEHVSQYRFFAIWLLLATTGMRRGEAAGLCWPDIDFDKGTVTIDWTLGERGGGTWKRRPKSAASRRTISLDPATLEGLRALWKLQAEERLAAGGAYQLVHTDPNGVSRGPVVCAWPDGSVVPPERWTKWLPRHGVAAGLPRIRLHDVRHSYATAALTNAAGWHEVKVYSERIGHAKFSITMDLYHHVFEEEDRQAANAMADRILGGES